MLIQSNVFDGLSNEMNKKQKGKREEVEEEIN